MNMISNHGRRASIAPSLGLGLLALGLAGCSGGGAPAPRTVSSVAPVQSEQWAQDRLKEAIALLNEGQADKARVQLVKLLKTRPGDSVGQSLLRQIDTDPRQLLGAENYAYTAREDDSFSGLAQRFLGDPMLAYALARYNGLASPHDLKPGQKLLIPGKPKPAPRVAARRTTTQPAAPRSSPAARPAPAPTAQAAAKPGQPAPNPAQAARLRGQGLAAMNGGAINRAVALLRQALSFDPGNALIRGDLARALRIQGTLASRR
jgi:LysM repeat protein